MRENIHGPDEADERELTDEERLEAMEDLAAEVTDQGGRFTATQRQQYNELKYGEGTIGGL